MGHFTGVSTNGKGKKESNASTILLYGSGPEITHSTHFSGEKMLTWPHLTAKEAEKCSLVWELYASLQLDYCGRKKVCILLDS